MIIVDGHQDLAYNAISYGRDYRESALKKRQDEVGTIIRQQAGLATCGLPEAIAGRVAIIFATLFVAPDNGSEELWSRVMYKTTQEAYRLGVQQLDVYNRWTDEDDRLKLIKTRADLDAVLATWAEDKDIRQRKQGLVLLMENADPITEPRQFEFWYERGIRVVGPAWMATRYSAGTGISGSLTNLGRELLEVMAGFNAILDLSHMAENAFLESLDRYEGIVIAGHSNPRQFVDTDRHLSDHMIQRLAERDGVMGVVMFNGFLDRHWHYRDGKQAVTLSNVADVIDHVCQITGSSAHVGIGSDLDGGFGAESIPNEIDTVADLWRIQDSLLQRGYEPDDITAIMSGNFLRKLHECLP